MSAAVPRFQTPRSNRESRGELVEATSLLISRTAFMPWQRELCETAFEIDPATGLLWYEIVVLVVPRQQGKTTALEPVLVEAALRRPDIDVIYTAQDRQMSKRRLIDELADKRLARRPELVGQFKIRRSNGSEGIRWGNGSLISTAANTDSAGHGLTLDKAVIDEAFAHKDLTVVTALDPTMITRPDPQLWIVSTVGDGTDGLLQHYQELGELSLGDPASRICYLEYSAGDDEDRDDPATWIRTMPAIGHTLTVERVRGRRASLTPEVFDRAYLCRRPTFDLTAKIPPAAWASSGPTDGAQPLSPVGPFVIALDVPAARSSVTLAVAGRHTEGSPVLDLVTSSLTGSQSDVCDGIWTMFAGLQDRGGAVELVADRRAGAGGLIDALAHLGIPVTELGSSDVVTNCGTLYDLVTTGELRHDGQPLLNEAAAKAVTRPLGDAWAWDRRRSPVEISELVAGSNAIGHHRSTFGNVGDARIY